MGPSPHRRTGKHQAGVLQALLTREAGLYPPKAVAGQLRFPEAFARTLREEAVLNGHSGCVNRLCWSDDGAFLASGSDDRLVLLWQYPDVTAAPVLLETMHTANIFGVRFLPTSNSQRLVTGAMDCTVQLHCLDAAPAALAHSSCAPGQARRPQATRALTTVFSCHCKRVKEVEVDPASPHMFWSAGEDGDVRQYDLRQSTGRQSEYSSANVLVSPLRAKATRIPLELKSLAINRVCPHQLAVAANDHLVRVYDRRMLSPGRAKSTGVLVEPLLRLAPPHLLVSNVRRLGLPAQHATHVRWGARGDRLVANYHSDHAYAFDTTRCGGTGALAGSFPTGMPRSPRTHRRPPGKRKAELEAPGVPRPGGAPPEAGGSGGPSGVAQALPEHAEAAKAAGNRAYFDADYAAAAGHYTAALHLAPSAALLYANRAQALLSRKWEGDDWAALQDCEMAIRLDPDNQKAHFRRVLALDSLGHLQAAAAAASAYLVRWPEGSSGDMRRLRARVAEEAALAAQRAQHSAAQRVADRRRRAAPADRAAAPRWGRAPQREPRAASLSPPPPPPPPGPSPSAEVAELAGRGSTSLPSLERATFAGETPAEARGTRGRRPAARRAAIVGADALEELLRQEAESEGEDEGDPDEALALACDAACRPHADPDSTPEAALASAPDDFWSGCVAGAERMLGRYMGHCNVQTDIKEATFLGADDVLVAAGSDDGRVFIYDAATGALVRVLAADAEVANCVCPHPAAPVLATSGIETAVRLWAPGGGPDAAPLAALAARNQERMRKGPNLIRYVSPHLVQMVNDNPDMLQEMMAHVRGDDIPLGARPRGECILS